MHTLTLQLHFCARTHSTQSPCNNTLRGNSQQLNSPSTVHNNTLRVQHYNTLQVQHNYILLVQHYNTLQVQHNNTTRLTTAAATLPSQEQRARALRRTCYNTQRLHHKHNNTTRLTTAAATPPNQEQRARGPLLVHTTQLHHDTLLIEHISTNSSQQTPGPLLVHTTQQQNQLLSHYYFILFTHYISIHDFTFTSLLLMHAHNKFHNFFYTMPTDRALIITFIYLSRLQRGATYK